MTVVAGLDIATRLCGWAAGDGLSVPQAGAWILEDFGPDYGALGDMLETALVSMLRRYGVTHLGFEAPMLNPKRDHLHTLRRIYGLEFMVETICRRMGVECREVGAKLVKRELTGNSFAEKADMVAVAEKVSVILPKTKAAGREDAADAFAVWKVGINQWAPPAVRTRWDRVILGPRGTLL